METQQKILLYQEIDCRCGVCGVKTTGRCVCEACSTAGFCYRCHRPVKEELYIYDEDEDGIEERFLACKKCGGEPPNRCMECGEDMGSCNTRQLCGKLYCLNEILSLVPIPPRNMSPIRQ